MHYQQQRDAFKSPNRVPALFPIDHTIWIRSAQRIKKDPHRILKSHTMLTQIRPILPLIPLKPDRVHAIIVITFLS